MAGPKDVLVVTTSTVDGLKIKRYLKPVSAHVVAGTNVFSDIFASFSDVFGGRSQTYQKQLTSLYNEAIEKVKIAAYELGANCVIGLSVDIDEISGKGTSMFMITALGTAVIAENAFGDKESSSTKNEMQDMVGSEIIDTLRIRKSIVAKAESGELALTDDMWEFITENEVDEVFPFLLKHFSDILSYEQAGSENQKKFYNLLLGFVDSLPENKQKDLVYAAVKETKDELLAGMLIELIEELQLFDFKRSMDLLMNDDFQIRKRAIPIVTSDKPYYDKQDVKNLQVIRDYIMTSFIERGTRTTKKQLLSSKEKEKWTCECGVTNDMENYCYRCGHDIYGFKHTEMKPAAAEKYIGEKVDLINEVMR